MSRWLHKHLPGLRFYALPPLPLGPCFFPCSHAAPIVVVPTLTYDPILFCRAHQLSLTALQGLALRWEHRPHAVAADRARAYYAGAAAGAFVGTTIRPRWVAHVALAVPVPLSERLFLVQTGPARRVGNVNVGLVHSLGGKR